MLTHEQSGRRGDGFVVHRIENTLQGDRHLLRRRTIHFGQQLVTAGNIMGRRHDHVPEPGLDAGVDTRVVSDS